MTTYNGTNMGLEQDTSGNWVFTNPAQTFVDPDTFTTADPAFQYAPTDTTDTTADETTDPCPAGYIYDDTLKQCVPDPSYQVPSFLGEPEEGDYEKRVREESEEKFIEFDASTPEGREDMWEHAVKNDYIDEKTGKLKGPPEAPKFLGVTGQFGENVQYQRFINELNRENQKRLEQGLPAVFAQAINYAGVSPYTFKKPSLTDQWTGYALSDSRITGFQPITTALAREQELKAIQDSQKTFAEQFKTSAEILDEKIKEEKLKQEEIKTEQRKEEARKGLEERADITGAIGGVQAKDIGGKARTESVTTQKQRQDKDAGQSRQEYRSYRPEPKKETKSAYTPRRHP
jgi:hypothetical protein